jgi:hypothetical protein
MQRLVRHLDAMRPGKLGGTVAAADWRPSLVRSPLVFPLGVRRRFDANLRQHRLCLLASGQQQLPQMADGGVLIRNQFGQVLQSLQRRFQLAVILFR